MFFRAILPKRFSCYEVCRFGQESEDTAIQPDSTTEQLPRLFLGERLVQFLAIRKKATRLLVSLRRLFLHRFSHIESVPIMGDALTSKK